MTVQRIDVDVEPAQGMTVLHKGPPVNVLMRRMVRCIMSFLQMTRRDQQIFLAAGRDDTGYPHDGRADNAAYRHDRRADKRRYPHDREIDIQMLNMFRN